MQRKSRVFAILTIVFVLSIGYAQFVNFATEAANTLKGRVFGIAATSDPTVDFAPMAIKLDTFEAFTDGNTVSLKWLTGGESGNLGFNVYREADGERELLNAAPIAGSALRWNVELVASGESYGWIDADAKRGAVYYLEDISIDGTTTLHGPISPIFKGFVNKFERQSALLSELSRVGQTSAEKEFVGEREIENSSLDQAQQWQIAAQSGVKIAVDHDGWYRVSAAELQSAGFNTSTNRNNWQLFVSAQQVPMKIGGDGAIFFFGRGVDTLESGIQVYYLINGQTAGVRITDMRGGTAEEDRAQNYRVTVQRKDRSLYVSSILNGDAENWFGGVISGTAQTVQNLTLNKVDGQNPARVSVRLQGLSAGEHAVNVVFNNFNLGVVSYSETQNREFQFDVPESVLIDGINSVKLQSVGAGNDVSLVDTVSVTYSRLYKAVNSNIRFSLAAGDTVTVSNFSTPKIAVYEIQNGSVTRQVDALIDREEGNGYCFDLEPAYYDREFIALPDSQHEQPALIEANVPSDLNSAANRADIVIITPTILRTQASQLAQMRAAQGFNVYVALTEDVADEFGSGVITSDSVKQFLQRAAATWTLKPKFAILFGDSSFDSHGYLGNNNPNLVPTRLIDTAFMESSSDTWLADFNNDGIEDIALGRLPAGNEAEANLMIAKLIRYDNQASRTTKTDVLISDRYFESYNTLLQASLPNNVQSVRLDRVSMSDAEFRSRLIAEQNNTPMVVTYTGHGSTGIWSTAAIFSNLDAPNLNNSKLSFYMLMTCMNGFSHNTTGDSLAEALLKAPNGAIATWASSAIVTAEGQSAMSQKATSLVFAKNNRLRFGDIARQAKAMSTDQDVRRTWQLFGDPTILVK